MVDECSDIIDKLVEIRHKKCMTQKDLAAATSLTQSVIARFERKQVIPQLDTFVKIASALDCSLKISSDID